MAFKKKGRKQSKKRKQQSSSNTEWTSKLSAWDNEDGNVGGYLSINVEYLEEIIDRYYEDDEAVVDDYNDGFIKFNLSCRVSEYDNGPDYYGGIYIPGE